ncbi:MAG: prolyl-tRNA synthetase associated domain-containing protein [Blautia sp.]
METKKNVSDLFTSTPDPAGRLEKEMLCYELLEKCQIPFAGVDHPPALTVDDCHDADILLGIHICKNLFLCNRQKTAFYLLLMPGHKVFKTRQLSTQIHSSRLSFGSPEEMKQRLNVTPGSVTVMGLMFDLSRQVQLLIDRDLLKEEVFGFHPCINTSSLRISTDDLIHKLIPALGHEPLYVDLTEETSPS